VSRLPYHLERNAGCSGDCRDTLLKDACLFPALYTFYRIAEVVHVVHPTFVITLTIG